MHTVPQYPVPVVRTLPAEQPLLAQRNCGTLTRDPTGIKMASPTTLSSWMDEQYSKRGLGARARPPGLQGLTRQDVGLGF